MPAKKLKSNIPTVSVLAREEVEVVRGLLRDKQNKVTGTAETFDRILPKDRIGIVEITTSIDNFGKKLSEIDTKELNFKRLVWNK